MVTGTYLSPDRCRFRAADAAIRAARHSDDEALYDRLGDRHDAAMKRMLRTPAPDLGALAVKLETLFGEQAWEMWGGELLLAAVLRDARRFAGGCDDLQSDGARRK